MPRPPQALPRALVACRGSHSGRLDAPDLSRPATAGLGPAIENGKDEGRPQPAPRLMQTRRTLATSVTNYTCTCSASGRIALPVQHVMPSNLFQTTVQLAYDTHLRCSPADKNRGHDDLPPLIMHAQANFLH